MNSSLSIEHLAEIRTFILVAEEKSFTKAAEILQISPTAVSKQIKKLEDSIRVNLFIRTTRQVSLTEFGEQLYQDAKKLQTQWESLQNLLVATNQCPKGKLTVATTIVTADRFVIPNLLEFRQRYPKIEVELKLTERIPNMQKENIDILLGFSMRKSIPENLKAKKLFTSKNILCASPSYLAKYGCPEKPEDLLRHQYIAHVLRDPIDKLFLADGIVIQLPKPVITLNSLCDMLRLCVYGNGIALIGDVLAKKYIASGELVVVLPNLPYPDHVVNLYFRSLAHQEAKIRCFIDFIATKIHFS